MGDYLVHYGVKGMKWGKHRAKNTPGNPNDHKPDWWVDTDTGNDNRPYEPNWWVHTGSKSTSKQTAEKSGNSKSGKDGKFQTSSAPKSGNGRPVSSSTGRANADAQRQARQQERGSRQSTSIRPRVENKRENKFEQTRKERKSRKKTKKSKSNPMNLTISASTITSGVNKAISWIKKITGFSVASKSGKKG